MENAGVGRKCDLRLISGSKIFVYGCHKVKQKKRSYFFQNTSIILQRAVALLPAHVDRLAYLSCSPQWTFLGTSMESKSNPQTPVSCETKGEGEGDSTSGRGTQGMIAPDHVVCGVGPPSRTSLCCAQRYICLYSFSN